MVQTLLVERRLLLLSDPSWDKPIGFEAYVPESVEEFARGVRPFEPLGPHEAMVFLFSKDSPKEFTMRNVIYDLDILFFDERGRLREIKEATSGQHRVHGTGKTIVEMRRGISRWIKARPRHTTGEIR